jgi:hypothetical protein
MLGAESKIQMTYLNINVDPDDDCRIPEFEVTRMRINY